MSASTIAQQQTLEALLELSGFEPQGSTDNVRRMISVIQKAPDPETACRVITEQFETTGALTGKWRQVIQSTWLERHPDAHCGFDLPLTTQDVMHVPALRDAGALLAELAITPAAIEIHEDDRLIAQKDLGRLMQAMPSLRAHPVVPEQEWGVVALRRMREVLMSLGLLRIYQGQLQVVQSRYSRWQKLSMPQQFYALWHADVYHVPWTSFAGIWERYFRLMQNYLPLLWEISDDVFAGRRDHMSELSQTCVDVFYPLWEQEGLLNPPTKNRTFYDVYEQSALPSVVERLVIQDLFGRYGLIETLTRQLNIFQASGVAAEVSMSHDHICWTGLGELLVESEREDDLPCAVEVLR